jgi:PGF-pre-PGF domain-containing protein
MMCRINRQLPFRMLFCILIIVLVPAIAAPVSAGAFNVTTISDNPPGGLVSGTPLTVSYSVNISGTGVETFPSNNELRMSTDLTNARWNYTLILDGVETPQPGWSGPTLSLSGWVLSYPSSIRESLNVTLEGTAPPVSSPISVTLVNVTEIDNHGDPVLSSQFTRRTLVIPPGVGATAVITFNPDLTITPGTTVSIPVGGTVVWVNDDPFHPHGVQATSTQTGHYFGGMSTVAIPYGTPFEVTFDRKGTYDHKTVFQPEMDGQIIVNGKSIVNFTGLPTTGTAPLTVTFTDESTGYPTGWAWFFGDENYTAPWTLVNGSAGWPVRWGHSSVAMPDGSIVLMGGDNGTSGPMNDVWRSTNYGATWTKMNASPGWVARVLHSSVVMPDSSIVLMGGIYDFYPKNDTWRSTDNGATWTQKTTSAGWTARYGQTSVVMPDGSIVLMGGIDDRGISRNDVWRSADNGATWTQVTANAGWPGRWGHNSVVMPDGSIVLVGGNSDRTNLKNDVWRSTDNGATWTQVTASAGWSIRQGHSTVVTPDGSIILMGGNYGPTSMNDVWRSTDKGATWTQVTANAAWSARSSLSSVAMPDGSIVLIGGNDDSNALNDVWRFTSAASSAQNPSHIYTTTGTYTVALQAYNTDGYDSMRKADYITVLSPPPHLSGITPAIGINLTSRSITDLAGTNFQTSGTTTVILMRAGHANITATGVTVVDSTQISCMFPIAGAEAGTWDVVVTNPDGQEGVLFGGFRIIAMYLTPVTTVTTRAVTWATTVTPMSTIPATTVTPMSTIPFTTVTPISTIPATTTVAPTTTTAPPSVPTYSQYQSSGSNDDSPPAILPLMSVNVNIGGNSKALQAKVTGTKLSELIVTGIVKYDPGPNLTAPPGVLYQYISLVPARYNTITKAEINFTIPNAWLDEHHIAPGNIVLYRQIANGWEPLPTTLLYTKDGTVYFSAQSNGFSLFAIAGTEGNTTPVTASTTQMTLGRLVQDQTPVQTSTTSAPVTSRTIAAMGAPARPTALFPLMDVIIVIGAVGVLATGGFLVRRWWIRRQNPVLFKKYD